MRSQGIDAIKRARPVLARFECGSHSMLSKPDDAVAVIMFATKIKQQTNPANCEWKILNEWATFEGSTAHFSDDGGATDKKWSAKSFHSSNPINYKLNQTWKLNQLNWNKMLNEKKAKNTKISLKWNEDVKRRGETGLNVYCAWSLHFFHFHFIHSFFHFSFLLQWANTFSSLAVREKNMNFQIYSNFFSAPSAVY